MILGLTGSLGSGKSTVARMFEELGGAKVIDADAIVHQIQAPGGSAYAPIIEAFGSEILQPDGTINRAKLASLVFASDEKRLLLNSIVHPLVHTEELRLLEQYRSYPLVVLMVPLLLENKLQYQVDRVVVVTVDEENRTRRLFERSRMTQEQIQRRLAAQMPDSEKLRYADFVVDNSGSLEKTRNQVQQIISKLRLEYLTA